MGGGAEQHIFAPRRGDQLHAPQQAGRDVVEVHGAGGGRFSFAGQREQRVGLQRLAEVLGEGERP